MEPLSTKPYLIRAIYEWCTDQDFTPYLAAMVDSHTRVPPGYAQNGQIVLNIAPYATNKLQIENEVISFQARFNGAVHAILIPISHVTAIYARENGQGMAFEVKAPSDTLSETTATTPPLESDQAEHEPPAPPPPGGKPHLRVVK